MTCLHDVPRDVMKIEEVPSPQHPSNSLIHKSSFQAKRRRAVCTLQDFGVARVSPLAVELIVLAFGRVMNGAVVCRCALPRFLCLIDEGPP